MVSASPEKTTAPHPLDQLHVEHELIVDVLARVDVEIERMQRTAEVRLDFWWPALDFLEHFVDDLHHGKEGAVLWPWLERAHCSREHGPLAHHDRGYEQWRKNRAQMVEAVAALDAAALARVATICTRQLRQHIQVEERVLFPLACEQCDEEQVQQLRARFEDHAGPADERRRLVALGERLRAML